MSTQHYRPCALILHTVQHTMTLLVIYYTLCTCGTLHNVLSQYTLCCILTLCYILFMVCACYVTHWVMLLTLCYTLCISILMLSTILCTYTTLHTMCIGALTLRYTLCLLVYLRDEVYEIIVERVEMRVGVQ